MRYKDLTDKQKEEFAKIYKSKDYGWDEKISILGEFIGKKHRTVRYWAKKMGLVSQDEPVPEQYEVAKKREFNKTQKRFIITWAQNNTPVHKEFLANVESYADYINADIHVIAGRYKNPTSLFNDEEEYWAKEVLPYLDANRHNIHEYATVMADVKVQPTAVNPLSGLAGLSGKDSCVFGHPKQQLEVIPTLEGYKEKIMVTTGACTEPNYTDSKAGKKGEFHHIIGFAIVEVDGNNIHIRQVSADDDGSFSDLGYRVNKKAITEDNGIEAIVLGDIHLGQDDETIMGSTFDILTEFEPNSVVLHDLFDAQSVNVHDQKNAFIQYRKETEGKNNLKLEVDSMLSWLGNLRNIVDNIIVVRSNHDDMVDRYLISEDWKKGNIKNALTYMEFASVLLSGKADIGIIPWVIKEQYPEITTLNLDSSYRINGWEIAQHGHHGANGSRGSINTFRKLSTKLITAHTHSCSTHDGHMCVGCTCKKKQGYNQGGASSWTNSHIIIHKDYNGNGNSKAQHIIINSTGRFTTLLD